MEPGSVARITGRSRSSSSRLRSSKSLISPTACFAESSTSNAALGTVAGSFFRTIISAQPWTAAREFRSSWFTMAKKRSRVRWSCCTSSSSRALSSCKRAFSTAAAVLAARRMAICSSSSVNASSTQLLRQIEIPEDAPLPHDRDPQERVHWRMVGREAVGVGVLGEVGEANRFRRADHQPQDAVAPRQISDERTLLGIDAVSGKALQEPAVGCQTRQWRRNERRSPPPLPLLRARAPLPGTLR